MHIFKQKNRFLLDLQLFADEDPEPTTTNSVDQNEQDIEKQKQQQAFARLTQENKLLKEKEKEYLEMIEKQKETQKVSTNVDQTDQTLKDIQAQLKLLADEKAQNAKLSLINEVAEKNNLIDEKAKEQLEKWYTEAKIDNLSKEDQKIFLQGKIVHYKESTPPTNENYINFSRKVNNNDSKKNGLSKEQKLEIIKQTQSGKIYKPRF